MAAFFSLLAGAVFAGGCVVLGHFHTIGREKFAHRKGYIAEQTAGILLIVGAALAFGNAIIVHGDQQLGVTLQPYQRKLTQRDIITAGRTVVKDQIL